MCVWRPPQARAGFVVNYRASLLHPIPRLLARAGSTMSDMHLIILCKLVLQFTQSGELATVLYVKYFCISLDWTFLLCGSHAHLPTQNNPYCKRETLSPGKTSCLPVWFKQEFFNVNISSELTSAKSGLRNLFTAGGCVVLLCFSDIALMSLTALLMCMCIPFACLRWYMVRSSQLAHARMSMAWFTSSPAGCSSART